MVFDNAIFIDRSNALTWFVETHVDTRIRERFESIHPGYSAKVPTLSTNMTQSDYWNQYIVRVFNNILMINMTGIWRTDLTSRLIINIPNEY